MFVEFPKDGKFKQIWTINVRDSKAEAVIFQHGNNSNAMLVLRGSAMFIEYEPTSLDGTIRKIHQGLRDDGTVDTNGVFTNHVVFNSPTMAAEVVQANMRDGREYWKHDGIPLGEMPGIRRHCYYNDPPLEVLDSARYL